MTKFIKSSLLLSAIAITASSAQANMPTFNAGVGIGYNSSKVGIKKNYNFTTRSKGSVANVGVTGPLAQIHLGTNHLFNNGYYLGLQLSASLAKIDGRDQGMTAAFRPGVPPLPARTMAAEHRTSLKMKHSFQVDTRLGKKMGDFIPHLILGMSFAQWKANSVLSSQIGPAVFLASRTKRCPGLVVGGGIDYNLTERFFIRGEYQYTWFKKFTLKDTKLNQFNVGAKPRTNVALISAGWRFG